MKNILFTLMLLALAAGVQGQNAPFNVHLEPMEIAGLPGLQAYAVGQHDGKWLLIGGRIDGLHRRQPFASFDPAGRNTRLYVVDPVAGQQWSASTSTLPLALQEQLASTNMQFYQDGPRLYLVGGYGFSAVSNDHVTFEQLTAVDVPGAIDAIVHQAPFTSFFRQISDLQFEVTGGRLAKIYDTYYLVGGQKFEGPYNPMGPTHGPGFVQQYTDQIRRFRIQDDGTTLVVSHLPAITDGDQLHRRDYNVVPQIMPDGQEGLTAFSGVFQKTVDLPYLNAVHIDSSGYAPAPGFNQYYNHYHCPTLPLFSTANQAMHTVFFGGIAQYYDSLGILVQDNNVPFVRTIARVTRLADGSMSEYKMPVEMPALLGASAEFIPAEGLPAWPNGVVQLDELPADSLLAGYIFGGIASTARNIFWVNTGTQSTADHRLFKVYLTKNTTINTHQINTQSTGTLRLQVFPNPNNGILGLRFHLTKVTPVQLRVVDKAGKTVIEETLLGLRQGENTINRQLSNIAIGATYFATLEIPGERATVKVIVQE
ncbi:MAG: T9SS type A sorting domain-containing protein [Saprospiraceae bacterium]|nr:T9SS type A sorting domain-containing protein [Saprospiraceae bacterium]